jgi:hypothetical protein
MKYAVMYLICGMLWGLWDLHYMIHISGQFEKEMIEAGVDFNEDKAGVIFVKALTIIGLSFVWPLVVLIDVPKVYIFDKIVYGKH